MCTGVDIIFKQTKIVCTVPSHNPSLNPIVPLGISAAGGGGGGGIVPQASDL
jgi:hypothetical protein